MDLLIVAATRLEITPLQRLLQEHFSPGGPDRYTRENLHISLLITGIGITFTAYHLGTYLAKHRPDIVLNAGIAGALDPLLTIGQTVLVNREEFADLGAEDHDGSFISPFQMGLLNGSAFPFTNEKLINTTSWSDFIDCQLPNATGLTVNKVHGFDPSIQQIKARTDAQIESMEGAAFFYACLQTNIPFLAIRSISNYVESRNRDRWNIPLAVKNLNEEIWQILRFARS